MRIVSLCILTFLLSSGSGWGKSFIEERFETFYERNLHYMAYDYMKQSMAMGAKLETKKVYKVIRNIHPSIFKNDRHIDLLKDRSDDLAYIAGARLFFKKNFKDSKKYLDKVSKKDPMYPEKSFLMAMMKYTEKDTDGAVDDLKRCYLYANRLDKKFAKNSVYPESIKNRCLMFLSRILFEKKDYKQSLYFQHKMNKTEAVWPQILLDKAWNFYWLKRYEQVIGTLLTYQAPVIKRFMWPEAHYLRALTYFELCYFEKAEKIYEAFDKDLYAMRNTLVKYGGPKHLMQLIGEKNPPENKAQNFLYYLLKSFKQDAKYALFKLNISQLNREINYL